MVKRHPGYHRRRDADRLAARLAKAKAEVFAEHRLQSRRALLELANAKALLASSPRLADALAPLLSGPLSDSDRSQQEGIQ